ncbi:MAG: ABC transporter permease [Planctomycetota bacterium]
MNGARLGAAVLAAVVLLVAAAPLVASFDWEEQRLTEQYLAPGEAGHLLGTDGTGRDLFARLLYGGRLSLLVGIAATLVSVVIGVTYGAISGYAGGRTDAVMMRIVDVLYSLPFLFLVILVMTLFLGPTASATARIVALLVVLGAIQWLTMARIVRGQVLSLKTREFVTAARSLGIGHFRILFRHIVPNVWGVVIVYATLTVPRVMLQEAFLSFLGLGIPEPYPSWGRLAADGVRAITPVATRGWLVLWPSVAICVTLLALNLVGEGLAKRTKQR